MSTTATRSRAGGSEGSSGRGRTDATRAGSVSKTTVSACDQIGPLVASTSRLRCCSGCRAAYLIGAMTLPLLQAGGAGESVAHAPRTPVRDELPGQEDSVVRVAPAGQALEPDERRARQLDEQLGARPALLLGAVHGGVRARSRSRSWRHNRAVTTIYYEDDAGVGALAGQSVAVVGYGNQGRSWALNLRDSGVLPVVCVRADASAEQAAADGFSVHEVSEAGGA